MATRDVHHKYQQARDDRLDGLLCPSCKRDRIVCKQGTWSWDFPVYGTLKVENALWYECPHCHEEVIPPALDEQIEHVMADADPVTSTELLSVKKDANLRARERDRQRRLRRQEEDPAAYRERARRREQAWRAEKAKLTGRL